MSLLASFKQNLASWSSIPVEDIQVAHSGVTAAGRSLGNLGEFSVLHYLSRSHPHLATPNVARVITPHRTVTLTRLYCHSPSIPLGITPLGPLGAQAFLFAGSFGTPSSDPLLIVRADNGALLEDYRDLLFHISCFEPRLPFTEFTWPALFEAWGPTIVSPKLVPEAALARLGLFRHGPDAFVPEYLPPATPPPVLRKGTPPESVLAYNYALRGCDGPDTTFLRLYRVLETQFAVTFKHQFAGATPYEVLDLIARLRKQFSELIMLRQTIARASLAPTRFTRQDFNQLFPAPPPLADQYTELKNWLSTSSAQPLGNARADLIYYVRNALVHSKLGTQGPALIGPWTGPTRAALGQAALELQIVVQDLLFT